MIIKKKYMLLIALAALVSCSSDEFVGDSSSPNGVNGSENAAISFDLSVPSVTRAERTGSNAADDLGNQFIVYGEKDETAGAPAVGKYVFPNYQVNYAANTAYTTTSNTKNWEYVGYTHSSNYQANITTCANPTAETPTTVSANSDAQTIKYWDYSASSYTFTAVSAADHLTASKTDIENGYIKIQKNTVGTTVFDKGYKVIVTGNADLSTLYFSDRTVISHGTGTDRNADNAYGGNVKFKFRNALSQVRAGIYETLPGYAISSISFYVNNTEETPTQTQPAKVGETAAFGAVCPNIKGSGFAGTLNVTYGSSGATLNQPIITVSDVTAEPNLILGTNTSTLTTSSLLGTTPIEPTWDTSGGAFTKVLPQVSNTTNLKLKCDYTLYNSVTGETINVTGATAEVPGEYLAWKPNFKYTYLFKITDNTNGSSGTPGTDPAGLYPITFDAVTIEASDGTAEYITTVSEPSITTFGVKNNKYIAEHGTVEAPYDYPASTAVYAVVEDGSSLATLNGGNMMLYTVTTENATSFPITAASVAEALIEAPTMNATQAAAAKIKFPANPTLTYQNTVPGEDGITITLDENKAATFTTATTATVYALVYQKTAATYNWDSGQEYIDSDSDHDSDDFTAAGALYTRTGAGTEESPYEYTLATSYVSGTTYYKPTAVSNKGEYVVKIVTCPNE